MMRSPELKSPDAIAEWIGRHLTKGQGMRRPYKRKWENGGCFPEHSLGSRPSGRVAILAAGMDSLGYPTQGVADGAIVSIGSGDVKVAADRSDPGDGPPRDYLIQILGGPVNYVGNSPEVIIELLRALPLPPPPRLDVDFIQIGFPGHEQDEATNVGSWQWDIHGEARGQEFVNRAAAATLAAIEAAGKD